MSYCYNGKMVNNNNNLSRLRALENSAASPTGPGHRGFSNPGFATLGEEAQQVGKPFTHGLGICYAKYHVGGGNYCW